MSRLKFPGKGEEIRHGLALLLPLSPGIKVIDSLSISEMTVFMKGCYYEVFVLWAVLIFPSVAVY